MSTSQIIGFDDITAGIVVRERPGRHRVHASHTLFRPLDGCSFSSVGQASEAARARPARRPRQTHAVNQPAQIAEQSA